MHQAEHLTTEFGQSTSARARAVVTKEIQDLTSALRDFARDREWDVFHSPKNLAMALNVEAGELLEHFQWLTEDQSKAMPPEVKAQVAEEIADVFLYLLQLSDKLGVDVVEAAKGKLLKNASKYPAHKARGNSKKYTEL
jgi:dCTP diphosphatase